jgi:hypothetical protein
MLNGEYVAVYQHGSELFPQVHDILHYVQRKNPLGPAPLRPELDPQYLAWEQGVIGWATSTIAGFVPGVTYNRPLPPGATLLDTAGSSFEGAVVFVQPTAGSYIQAASLPVTAQIRSQKEIVKIEVFFNDVLVDTRVGSFGISPRYEVFLSPPALKAQNTLRISATDITGVILSKEVVVYQ